MKKQTILNKIKKLEKKKEKAIGWANYDMLDEITLEINKLQVQLETAE